MFTVYIIRSAKGLRYIGYTENISKRLEQHDSGISKFTKRDSNWQLVYSEEQQTRAEAINREKWLKSGRGRYFLDQLEKRQQSGS